MGNRRFIKERLSCDTIEMTGGRTQCLKVKMMVNFPDVSRYVNNSEAHDNGIKDDIRRFLKMQDWQK